MFSLNIGFKPRGMVWITDPKKAMYNKTSRGCLASVLFLLSIPLALTYILWEIFIA
jgi:hypothetical protein